MEAQTIEKKAVKIIYNDDVAVLDFLADLTDREPIRQLQRFLDYSTRHSSLILAQAKADNLFVLILYKDPFGVNDAPNKIIMYAHPELKGLAIYFKNYRNQILGNTEQQKAIDDILSLIYIEWAEMQDKDVQADFLG